MKLIKDLILYWKYKTEINYNYGFALKEGYCGDETYNWQQRLDYWNECYDKD